MNTHESMESTHFFGLHELWGSVMGSRTLIWGQAGPADTTDSAAHQELVTQMYVQICPERLSPTADLFESTAPLPPATHASVKEGWIEEDGGGSKGLKDGSSLHIILENITPDSLRGSWSQQHFSLLSVLMATVLDSDRIMLQAEHSSILKIYIY